MENQRACYVMAISEMGQLEVSTSIFTSQMEELLHLSQSVLPEYSDTVIPSFINDYIESTSSCVDVDISRFCRIMTMLRCLDRSQGELDEDVFQLLEQVAIQQGRISFEQYCRTHVALEDVSVPLSICILDMTKHFVKHQTELLNQLFDRYHQNKTHLTRLLLRSKIDPEFDFETYKWSRIDKVHDARAAYRQHKINYDHWRLRLALLTLLDTQMPIHRESTEPNVLIDILNGLLGKNVDTIPNIPSENRQWIQVRLLLDQFIESHCTNQQIVKLLAGIVL